MIQKLLCLMGVALILLNVANAQGYDKKLLPLYIDGNLPDITFKNVINYKDSLVKLSDLQGPQKKLIIFDFWNVHCSVCIEQFPKEDSLQKLYRNDVQFVMIAPDSKQKVEKLISNWEQSHHQKLDIPIVTDDTTLMNKYIRVFYEPQFGWIDRWNRLIAQTNEYFLTKESIANALQSIKVQQAEMDSIAHLNKVDSIAHLNNN